MLSSPVIPIEALLEARPPGAPRYIVSYASSGTLFAWLQENRRDEEKHPPRPRRLLALGDPIPQLADERISKPNDQVRPGQPADAAAVAQRETVTLLRRCRGGSFERLPGSRREVEAIARLFDRSEVYLGSEASEQTLASLQARGELAAFAVIHMATHGQIDDISPMNSRLVFSHDKLSDPTDASPVDGPAYDGDLSAGEVMSTWKLNAELVTLSACRSGLGRQSGGEGFIGFAQAFFLAGSRSLLVSLWEVDDRATSLLMTRFYQNWLGNRPDLNQPLSKAEALHEAKAWLRGLSDADVKRELNQIARGKLEIRPGRPSEEVHPFAHPHDWAGFVLIGDPG